MREIRFRGKQIDSNKWVYGDLVHINNSNGINAIGIKDTVYNVNNRKCNLIPEEVDPESVGQYIGLNDKNNIKIYKGDIVKVDANIMEVSWSENYASFVLIKNGWAFSHFFGESCEPENCEIIGNKYESEELLNE